MSNTPLYDAYRNFLACEQLLRLECELYFRAGCNDDCLRGFLQAKVSRLRQDVGAAADIAQIFFRGIGQVLAR